MAWYSQESEQYLQKSTNALFKGIYLPGVLAPTSGIYRCLSCGHEMTAIKDDPLTTQDHSLYGCKTDDPVIWQLVAASDTATMRE